MQTHVSPCLLAHIQGFDTAWIFVGILAAQICLGLLSFPHEHPPHSAEALMTSLAETLAKITQLLSVYLELQASCDASTSDHGLVSETTVHPITETPRMHEELSSSCQASKQNK